MLSFWSIVILFLNFKFRFRDIKIRGTENARGKWERKAIGPSYDTDLFVHKRKKHNKNSFKEKIRLNENKSSVRSRCDINNSSNFNAVLSKKQKTRKFV